MKKVTTELDIHSVRIHIKSDERYNKAAIAFFSVFASLISLFPVLAIILFLSFDEAKVLGLVVATFFSLYVAFYLWRLVLWNVCGKETITISKKTDYLLSTTIVSLKRNPKIENSTIF